MVRVGKDFKEILEEVWPDYMLGRELGHGSFASVYEARRRDGVASTPSAIKVIPVPTSENEVEELRMEGLTGNRTQEYFQSVVDEYKREIKLMDVLKTDPHVVNIEDYKVCKVPDEMLWYIFIRMPRLTPLRTEMEKWAKEELEDKVVHLGTDLCKALESCQRYRIIHRDIKPENIFVTPQGDFRLGDFGVARNLGQTTRGLSRKGTPNYMAPELYRGEIIQDFRIASLVDQYSLGMVLYFVANGMCLPFYPRDRQVISADTRDAAFLRRINGDTLPPPENVSRGLQKIVLKALSYKPEDRYATPEELRRALEGYTRESRDLPLPAEMKKWMRNEIGARVAGLGIDLCGALENDRTNRALRGDIRPDNIFVSPQGKFYFGDPVAPPDGDRTERVTGDETLTEGTSGGRMAGEANLNAAREYMSPEKLRRERVDPRKEDQYALGMVLYYAANDKRLPFMEKETAALSSRERDEANSRRLRGEAPPPPKNVSKALQKVILKALSDKPAGRYAGLKEMKEALEKARDGKPRNPRWGLIAALVCLIAALGVGVWQRDNIKGWIEEISGPTPTPAPAPTDTPAPAPTDTPEPVPPELTANPVTRDRYMMARLKEAGLSWPLSEEELSAALARLPGLDGYLYVGLQGDVDGDGVVKMQDYGILKDFLEGKSDDKMNRYANGDMNGDGEIKIDDLSLFKTLLESKPGAVHVPADPRWSKRSFEHEKGLFADPVPAADAGILPRPGRNARGDGGGLFPRDL